MILALAGGVGGAKLAQGLSMLLGPDQLQIIVNTSDDFDHLGLHISPDLDTVMYWLAGVADRERGWGVTDESWNFLAALERIGGPTWFRLGDRDLATHVRRTALLNNGMTLSVVTRALCKELGVRHAIAPMSDSRVRTILQTEEGELDFQDYFVRCRCEPRVRHVEYRGAAEASMSPAFGAALTREDLEAIVICPSNPILSIDPILAVNKARAMLKQSQAPIVAVSPIVGGKALKGPAAKILQELGRAPSALEIAGHYAGLIDGVVIDDTDASLSQNIEATDVEVVVTDTIMTDPASQNRLAETTLKLAERLRGQDI